MEDRYHIEYDPIHYRLRCNGHIINLTAKSFLFHTDEDALDIQNNSQTVEQGMELPSEAEMRLWRRKGASGKAYNFTVQISRSPQRIYKWKKLSGGLLIPRDNETRWHSMNNIIRVLLVPRMRSAYDKWWQRHADELDDADMLENDEWIQLEKIHYFL